MITNYRFSNDEANLPPHLLTNLKAKEATLFLLSCSPHAWGILPFMKKLATMSRSESTNPKTDISGHSRKLETNNREKEHAIGERRNPCLM